jgi:hypothetical protein
MRSVTILAAILILLNSCDNSSRSPETAQGDTTYLPTEVMTSTTEVPTKINNLIWSATYDTANQHVILKQQRKVNPDTLTAEKIIKDINTSWDDIKLEYRKISHDTIYVAIPQSSTLTQGIGSSGAYNYMSSTTFSLTELKNIKYVNFDFVEGDHMAPGTMKRADFKQ